ncbi:hypothetical protein D7X94_10125 [Acutalibacter sp. 1XD8-33]|uniref:hypothetical protein n=1 Tax=Acutalibacter sp. 1XD8-33 TaxID=2320081 RepID=UPI000EA38C37|nr:hypothetical protein [Acutalibacter sp. 1XD8-33]RKJ39974.1 hypothetical protein D7X94_10125 [Acutalibacter sp. 1XD8-33]
MKRDRRPFWLGFGLGLFVFLTGAGFLAVDYQGRKLSFGDSDPLAKVDRLGPHTELTVKAFGREKSWDITRLDKAWEFLCDFGCIPHERSRR